MVTGFLRLATEPTGNNTSKELNLHKQGTGI